MSPFIFSPFAYLYFFSLSQSIKPLQWKCAIITHVPKIFSPVRPGDFRPSSVLPLFSTVLEKMVIHHHLYSLHNISLLSTTLEDKYAFLPVGSTTAAIVLLIQNVTSLLATEPYVQVFVLDFSKAFDVVRHSTLF